MPTQALDDLIGALGAIMLNQAAAGDPIMIGLLLLIGIAAGMFGFGIYSVLSGRAG